jgi:hypothetical protein
MAQRGSPLYDLEPADAPASWCVLVRRVFVCLSLVPCALLLAYALTDPEARDLNDLWNVEPVKTLDKVCTPRTFLLSPRMQCSQSLKQITISMSWTKYSVCSGGANLVEVDPSDPAADAQLDATLDHLW